MRIRGQVPRWTAAVLLCVALFGAGGGVAALIGTASGAGSADGQPLDSASLRRDEVRQLLETSYYRTLAPATVDAATATLSGLSATLGDPYTTYLSPAERARWARSDAGRYVGIGVVLGSDPAGNVVVTDLVDGGPAQRAGMRGGDVINEVDGRSVQGLAPQAVLNALHGAEGAPVTVAWRSSGGEQRVARMVRRELSARIVDGRLVVADGHRVGVISLSAFDTGVGAQVRSWAGRLRTQGADVLVLDLRGNGGGLVAETLPVVSAFVDEGSVVFTERGEHVPTHVYRSSLPPVDTGTPLAVLVDRSTASAAEIVAAALRDDGRAELVGSHTFGKGVIQDIDPLSDGGALKITVAEYLTPAGLELDRRGLDPDVTAQPSAGESTAESDPAVETAVRAALSR